MSCAREPRDIEIVSGLPSAILSVLVDLHHLLIDQGFRRSSGCNPSIVREEHDGRRGMRVCALESEPGSQPVSISV
jgi:hypothetical protein